MKELNVFKKVIKTLKRTNKFYIIIFSNIILTKAYDSVNTMDGY